MFDFTRADFEEWAMPVFERLQRPLDEALEAAAMGKNEIDEVVIVGGSTRIPWVRDWLKEYFEKDELCETVDADEGVAYGAALLAGTLSPNPIEPPIIQVTMPISLGIEIPGDKHDVLIAAGMAIPCSVEKEYMTLKDNQTAFKIRVLEGNSLKASECGVLAKAKVPGIPKDKKYKQRIKITMSVDVD